MLSDVVTQLRFAVQTSVLLLVVGAFPATTQAMIWHRGVEPTAYRDDPRGPMRAIVKLRYSSLKVFGGCGVLIDSQHVLTARHAAIAWRDDSLHVEVGGHQVPVQTMEFPADAGVDLAILRLQDPILDVTPAPLLAPRPQVGQQVWLGGFGFSGPLGKATGVGLFTSGFNRLWELRGHRGRIRFDPPGEQAELHEVLPSMFDSGSPVFAQHPGGWALAGITVTVTNVAKPNYGDRSSHELIANVQAWLREKVPDAKWIGKDAAQKP